MDEQKSNPPPYQVSSPSSRREPLVFASPHSGQVYPNDLMIASNLSHLSLRRSADNFVDQIFAAAPRHGAPLLCATYARAYLDLNREPWELDPQMFDDVLPAHANTTSLRVAGGLGTIPRLASDGRAIYRGKLDFAEVQERLKRIYFPYHHCLARMLEESQTAFGYCLLIDCHSMPSTGSFARGRGDGASTDSVQRADIVLGDRFGAACAPELTDHAHNTLSGLGLRVQRNNPYAGGFTTYHYGRPATGVHALQIEINRRLYMDEDHVVALPGLARIRGAMTTLITALSSLSAAHFGAQEAAE